jgi:hypothetical protein
MGIEVTAVTGHRIYYVTGSEEPRSSYVPSPKDGVIVKVTHLQGELVIWVKGTYVKPDSGGNLRPVDEVSREVATVCSESYGGDAVVGSTDIFSLYSYEYTGSALVQDGRYLIHVFEKREKELEYEDFGPEGVEEGQD